MNLIKKFFELHGVGAPHRLFLWMLVLSAVFHTGTIKPVSLEASSNQDGNPEIDFLGPAFILPVPSDLKQSSTLGIKPGQEFFRPSDVQCRYMVIQLVDLYCHACQQSAANLKTLADNWLSKTPPNNIRSADSKEPSDQSESGLSQKESDIVVWGIGYGNTAFELQKYVDKFEWQHPAFPDREKVSKDILGVTRTPTVIVLKRNMDGKGWREVYRTQGYFSKVDLRDVESLLTQ